MAAALHLEGATIARPSLIEAKPTTVDQRSANGQQSFQSHLEGYDRKAEGPTSHIPPYADVEEGGIHISNRLGIQHNAMPQEAFHPPGLDATPEELKAWELAQQYEVMLMAEVAKDLYVPSQALADEGIIGEEENMYAPELSQAFARAAMETGTDIASNSLARNIYFEILTLQGDPQGSQKLRMDI